MVSKIQPVPTEGVTIDIGGLAQSSSPPQQPQPSPVVFPNSTTAPSGFGATQIPAAAPETATSQRETVVVPTGVQPSAARETFIPQPNAVGNTVSSNSMPPEQPSGGSSFIKTILILIILIGLGIGGWFLFQFMTGGKEVTLTYWGLWENENIITPIITDFQAKNPKIKIEYVKQSHTQYRERLAAAIERGEGPDVFRFHNTWVPMFKNDLAPAPKTIITPEEVSTTFYPVVKNDLVAGSTIYGLPLMIDGLGLYINNDLFAAAGVSPPVSWEDVLTIVPKLTVRNGDDITTSAIALGVTGNIENFSDILAVMMLQNGANLANPTGKEAEEALIFYRKFADPSDPVYTWNSTRDNDIYAFANGRVAMILAPSWRAFDIRQINPSANFKIVPTPQLPGNTVTWASYWVEGVSAKSKNQQAAWEFVKYLTSHETAMKLYSEEAKIRLFGEPYARTDLATSVAGDQYVEAYIKQAMDAKSFPLASRTHDNGLNDQLIKYLEDAVNSVTGGSSPQAALQTAANGFRQVLGKYGLATASAPGSQ